MKKEKCFCCGCYTLPYEDPEYAICPVCFWEYDKIGQKKPDIAAGGPNKDLSLNQAQENYKRYGVFDLQFKAKVRAPLPEELPENN